MPQILGIVLSVAVWNIGLKKRAPYSHALRSFVFFYLQGLENIPLQIGDIAMIQKLWMASCCDSVVKCAKDIVEEQMDLQGDDLPFHIEVRLLLDKNEVMNEAMLYNSQMSFKCNLIWGTEALYYAVHLTNLV